MKTIKSFHFIVILGLLLVTLPVQSTRATPAASAAPAAGWAVGSWSGTSNNSSTSSTNSVIMPSGSQTVMANYSLNTYRIYLPQVIR